MTKKSMECKMTVRTDKNFMRDIESTCDRYHYKKSEFVREAIRRFIKDLEGD